MAVGLRIYIHHHLHLFPTYAPLTQKTQAPSSGCWFTHLHPPPSFHPRHLRFRRDPCRQAYALQGNDLHHRFTHTYIHTHIHTHTQDITVLNITHADRPTLSKVTSYTTNAHIHKHKHTTYTHAPRIRTQAHTYTHHAYTCKHTHHACTHTNTHTHTHTHAHTHTHTPQMPVTGDVPSSRGLHSMTAVSPLQGTSPTQLILFGGAPQRGPMVGEAVFTRV